MKIQLKTPAEIEIMRKGGAILAQILQNIKNNVTPGITTRTLNELAENLIRAYGVIASFKNYRGYPASICTSVNEEVVHAIPSDRILKTGDIISIDCGIQYQGLHVDATIIAYLSPLKAELYQLINIAEKALTEGIKMARNGNHVGDISHTIETIVKNAGYSIVKELTGHGVGHTLHEPPAIPNFGAAGSGAQLLTGTTLAIEPIINFGSADIKTNKDGWTIVTKDQSPSVQIEHTIVITESGPEILTAI